MNLLNGAREKADVEKSSVCSVNERPEHCKWRVKLSESAVAHRGCRKYESQFYGVKLLINISTKTKLLETADFLYIVPERQCFKHIIHSHTAPK